VCGKYSDEISGVNSKKMGNNFVSGMSFGLFQVPFKKKNKIKKPIVIASVFRTPSVIWPIGETQDRY
jgi:hypothetical protein